MENVKRFNIISYILYVLAIGFCFVNNEQGGMHIIDISSIFSIKFETVILLVLGSFSAVVAYVFHEAIKIREESEELKEESKYIIQEGNMPIIVNLDVMMAKRKMSLNELSEQVGVTPANLSILKTGKAKAVRFSTLEAICKVLECQPGDILEYR